MTQGQRILKHLRSGRSLTSLQALDLFGCMRLASRINDLRGDGHPIKTEPYRTTSGKIVARYTITGQMSLI